MNILEKKWMLISLKSNIVFKIIKIYSVGQKKKKIIDIIFDKLYEQEKITWFI